jgi:hypothetical protein
MVTADPDETRSYRLDPTAFEPSTKRRLRLRFIWIVALALVVLVIRFAVLPSNRGQDAHDTWPLIMGFTGGTVFLGIFMVRMWRSAFIQGKPEWDSFRLTISSGALRRASANYPPVEIRRTEVTAIVEQPDGLRVMTEDRHRAILVPRQLTEFLDARERLSAWSAFEAPKLADSRLLGFAWGGTLLVSLLATLLIRELLWAMVAGAVLVVVAGLLIRELRKSQSLSKEHKASLTRLIARFMLAPLLRLAIHFVQHAPWLH